MVCHNWHVDGVGRQPGIRGFTLVELVAVIAILGVLAATALPRFVDLKKDAQKAQLAATMGAMKSSANMIHAKWMISPGLTSVVVQGQSIPVSSNGWPSSQYWDVPRWGADISMFPKFFHPGANLVTYSFADRYCGFTYSETDGSVVLYGSQC